MHESNRQPGENPLEDLADELSQGLDKNQIELDTTSAGQVQAGQVWMRNSAARAIRTQALHSEDSALGFTRANMIEVNKSALGISVAQEAHLNDSTNTVLIAKRVEARNTTTLFLIAGRVEGDVRSVFTPLTALAVGAGLGAALYIFKTMISKIGKFPASSRG